MNRKMQGKVHRYKSAVKSIVCLMLICLMTPSCLTFKNLPRLETAEVSSRPYEEHSPTKLYPGDVIEIKFRYWPELNETQTVRPDGNISLQLVDDVTVTGLTPTQVDEHLTKLYEDHLKDPILTVVVRSLANQRVYIGGAVGNQGLLPIDGNMTALEAIMQSGGFNTATADASNVILLRNIDGKRYASMLDLKNSFYNSESNQYFLEPNDMLFVPRTRIVRMNEWIQQHITGLIPDMLNASQSKSGLSHSNSIGVSPRGLSTGQ